MICFIFIALSLSKVVGTVKIVESCSAGCLVDEDSVLYSEPLAMIRFA